MTEPSRLPPLRELPAPTTERIRTRVLAGTGTPAPTRSRWLPLAAAAAVIALVVGAVAVANRRPETAPAAPAPTPTKVALPSLAEIPARCGVGPDYDYVTRYEGDGAVTWLFIQAANKSSIVCTWKIGSTGRMADFINDWFSDGMAPARDGQIHVTQDIMMPGMADGATLPPDLAGLERDRKVLVGPVPAEVTKVTVEKLDGSDGEQVAALGSHWFLYHFRKPGHYKIYGYDADGHVVTSSDTTAD
jgi:hypothetical protein